MKAFILGLILVTSINIANALGPKPTAEKELSAIKIEIEENAKKQIPNYYSEELYQKLKVATPMCERSKFIESVNKCSYFKCLYKVEFFNGLFLYSDLIVQGPNSTKHCVVLGASKRYFVPEQDRPTFGRVFYDNQSLQSFSGESSGADSSTTASIIVNGKKCKVRSSYKNLIAPPNNEIVKFNPPKEDGMKIEGTESFVTQDGVTYKIKSLPVQYVVKLEGFSVTPDSPSECISGGATKLLELERNGLIQELNPPKYLAKLLGFPSAD